MGGILCNFNGDYVETKPLKLSVLYATLWIQKVKHSDQYYQRNPGSVTPTIVSEVEISAQPNLPVCFASRCSHRTGVFYLPFKNCLPMGN